MLYIIGSIVLASLQLISQVFLSHKNRWGWTIAMTACVIAVPYEYITHQYGFLVVCFVNFVIAWRAYRRWSADENA